VQRIVAAVASDVAVEDSVASQLIDNENQAQLSAKPGNTRIYTL